MRPRARLVSLIGEELISEEEVAIVELVKNAYDASATEVKISFDGSGGIIDSITIEDDGDGMTLETIKKAWFEIGTVYKKDTKNKTYLGDKGIGRFAAMKLGKTLTLKTKHREKGQELEVVLDWDKFNDDTYLDDIETVCEIKSPDTTNFGTTLIIEKVNKEIWNSESYKKLKERLSRLIGLAEQRAEFNIFLSYIGKKDTLSAPAFLNDPKYSIKGEIFSKEETMNSKIGYIRGKITYPGEEGKNSIVNIFPKNPDGEKINTPLSCGGFSFEIKVWDRDVKSLNAIVEKYDIKGKRIEVKKAIDSYCGVSLYRDGFRVYPYGDQGNDWLKLDKDTRQNPTKNLANNQVIGKIFITKNNNPSLIDRTSREGLINNEAYFSLINVIKHEIFSKIQKLRYDSRRNFYKQEKSIPESLQEIRWNFKEIKNQFKIGELNKESINAIEKEVTVRIVDIEKKHSNLIFFSGFGQLAHMVLHEIKSPIGKINRENYLLLDDIKKAETNEKIFNKYEERIKKITRWLSHHNTICKRLDKHMPNKLGKAQSFSVIETLQEEAEAASKFYSSFIRAKFIDLQILDNSRKKNVFMSESAVSQIVYNLTINAIYWVQERWKKNDGGKIVITLNNLEKGFSITIDDNGVGVEDKNKDKIFDIYHTSKENGQGLGLHMCKLLIKNYGEIYCAKKSTLGGACFVVNFKNNTGI